VAYFAHLLFFIELDVINVILGPTLFARVPASNTRRLKPENIVRNSGKNRTNRVLYFASIFFFLDCMSFYCGIILERFIRFIRISENNRNKPTNFQVQSISVIFHLVYLFVCTAITEKVYPTWILTKMFKTSRKEICLFVPLGPQ
jgi:hypothetical protein